MQRAAQAPAPVYNIGRSFLYGGVPVKFKPLLERWKKESVPPRTAEEYAVRLSLDDASRLRALAELFPGCPLERIITDLLHAALDEIAASMPYEAGPKVISRDDQGDPVYEDVGLTPRFVEASRKFKKSLEAAAKRPPAPA
ncbi:MAG TPA: pilin assembly protein [Steroidobacteraceae bacterium]|nr:pilin assembly protein [Steroidobacteraceae bacterium]